MSTAESTPVITRDFSKFSAGIQAFQQTSHNYKSRKRAAEAARRRLKVAEFNNTDTEFENSFASIAFTYLKERAPSLVENLVGFQLLDKSEENQKACGVFVCQVGQRLIDIPMFFINGEVKGYQVMRIRAPEIFLPLREGFLDYVISQMTNDIGEVGPPVYEQNALRSSPNLDVFAGQRYFKGAGERDAHLSEWAEELKVAEEYRHMRCDKKTLQYGIDLLEKKANYVDLKETLAEYSPLLKTANELAHDYPHFERFMERSCGKDWRTLGKQEKTASAHITPPSIRKRSTLSLSLGKQAAEQNNDQPSKAKALVIRPKSALPEITKLAQQLGHDAEPLVQEADKYRDIAFDKRDRSKLAEAYVMGEQYTSYAPDGIEICQVLLPTGFKDILVVPAKFNQGKPTHDFLYDFGTKQWTMAPPSSYVARRREGFTLEKEQKAISKVISGTSRKPKAKELFMVMVNDNQFYGPFLCCEKLGPREFEVDDVRSQYEVTSDIVNRSHGGAFVPDGPIDSSCEINKIIFSRNNAPASVNKHGYDAHLSVPENSRILPIRVLQMREDSAYPEDRAVNWYRADYDTRKSCELVPTDMPTFLRDMIYGRTNLKIASSNERTVSINNNPMSVGAARRALMVQYELSKEAAEEIIITAGPKSKQYIVTHPSKLADTKAKLAFYSPSFDEPVDRPIYPSQSGRFGVQEADMQSIQTNTENPQREYREPWEDPADDDDSFSGNSQEELDAILQNDKGNIMDDMAGFISILRNTRVDTSMRKLTKSLLNTIDQLGRQIFIFYAHQDEYKEMFGENEVADIESSLITVFESAGDLFISFVRRSDDPTPELDIVDLPVA